MLLLLAVGAYLLGAVPAAYLVARWRRGIDLRRHGSGNVGASNVLATVSRRWGLVVIVFDLVKGMLAVYTARVAGLAVAEQIVVGLAAIIGHNWPVFLRFQGGRGALATLGVSFVLAPKLVAVFLAVALLLGLRRQLALGTLIAVVALPTCSYLFPGQFGIPEGDSTTIGLGFTATFLLAVVRRLAVPRASIAASLSTGQVLVNRLLFDRDIREREAWIRRAPESGRDSGGDRQK